MKGVVKSTAVLLSCVMVRSQTAKSALLNQKTLEHLLKRHLDLKIHYI